MIDGRMALPAGIKLRQLEYFLAVADSLHFTNAAQALYVTQPTLSHQIAQLEARLGFPLLNRIGKKVTLTEAGRLFQSHASRALQELRAGQDALTELEGLARGELRIGIIQSFCFTLLPPLMEKFVGRYPSIRMRIENVPARAIEEGLARGRLDVGIAFAPATLEETEAEPILEERMLLVAHRSHPLARRKTCAVSQLDGKPMALLTEDFSTRQLIDRALAQGGAKPKLVCETNSIEVMLAAVRSGKVLTILPERAFTAHDGLVGVALRDPTPRRVSALLWNRHSFRSQAARTFAAMLRESFGLPAAAASRSRKAAA